jgi:hypothetical protein
MTVRFRVSQRAIEEALARCGTRVVAVGPGRWHLGNAERGAIRVQWDEPWLAFETAANGASPHGTGDEWHLLRGQGSLPAAVRYAMPPRGGLQIAGDVATDGGADLGTRCRDVVDGLVAARAARPAPHVVTADPAPEKARELVEAIAWKLHERPDGRLAGRLPGVERAWSAELTGERGGLRLSVEIASMRTAGDTTRLALGEVLLKAGHLLRFARPGIDEDGERCSVRFETRLRDDAAPAELRHALAALAAACDECAAEVRALQHEEVAKSYLILVRGNAS